MNEFLTVSELNNYIGSLLDCEPGLHGFWLKGEISGFKLYQQSGHMYFTLKDQESSISCVMFKSRARTLGFQPEDGMEVLLRGSVSVFARQGKYQVYAEEMQPYGVGGLFLYLEKLKARLEAEGCFAADKKRTVPRIVNRLGIVTSQDGAALRDILKVVRQRHSKVEIVLVHSAVQGLDAPTEIARGIRWLNRQNYVDLIIVGRGGGSFEDLMAFNSEEVVRAICESVIPVISAVGHEVDYCLADLAADLRAATPTQAAQLAVPDIDGLEADINNFRHRLIRAIDYKISYRSETLDRMMIKKIWTQPGVLLEERRHDVRELRQQLCQLAAERCKDKTMALYLAATALDKLSPLKVLQRGYAIASREGQIINKGEQVNIGDEINIDLYQDRLAVKVIGKETVIRW